jgi:hypothetical protein
MDLSSKKKRRKRGAARAVHVWYVAPLVRLE